MMNMLGEPGFWLLAAMVGFTAHMAVGAVIARPHFRAMLAISDEVLSSPDTTKSDKKIVGFELYSATVRWPYWLFVAFAPVIGAAGIVFGLSLFVMPSLRAKVHAEVDASDVSELDRIILEGKKQQRSNGPLWQNDRRARLSDHSFAAQALTTPLFTAWIGLMLLPAIILMALSGAIAPTAQALKAIITSISRWIISALSPRHAA